ncbi:MAG: hypothetical protein QOE65_82 [Solirubrobacteraceae bacterium]|nr:hypothetical protein [Solirubrobacteraceae bacterium]
MIVPTRDRLAKLQRTVDALETQVLGEHRAELVVVDNGSRDDTVPVLRERLARFPWPAAVHVQRKPGASAARNLGVERSSGRLLVFVGDDTRPASDDFVAAHCERHARRPESEFALLGRIQWAPELEITPLMSWLDRGIQFNYDALQPGPVSWRSLFTSNLSLKRALLDAVGGFEERIPIFFEDLELGLRLHERGMELSYEPQIVTLHDHATTLGPSLARQEIAGRSARVVNELHPGAALLPRPGGASWLATRALGGALRAIPLEWQAAPGRVRDRVYRTLHLAAYARGYRGRTA